jgi:hypothetical protein
MAKKDETGKIYSFLTVIQENGVNKSGQTKWLCKCECGKETTAEGASLRLGRVKSCGCKSPKFTSEKMKKHGLSRTRTYSIWAGMKARCNPNAKYTKSHLYSEKGIMVCEKWKKFENFYADMGEAPTNKTLGRLDGNKGYCLENCRWETYTEQANNTTKNHWIEFNNKKMTIAQWANLLGIKQNTLLTRVRRGWKTEKALLK